MSWHNDTCGCAECGNYGQKYNPRAIHNQSCGCAECGNYDNVPIPQEPVQPTSTAVSTPTADIAASTPKKRRTTKGGRAAKKVKPAVKLIEVPIDLVDEVLALIAQRRSV